MSEKSIRWFCLTCNDFVSIRQTVALKEKHLQVERLPYPIIIKHGNPPHYTILQLDRDLRDRGRLTSRDYIDLTVTSTEFSESEPIEIQIKEQLEQISDDLSNIQRKIWDILDK